MSIEDVIPITQRKAENIDFEENTSYEKFKKFNHAMVVIDLVLKNEVLVKSTWEKPMGIDLNSGVGRLLSENLLEVEVVL